MQKYTRRRIISSVLTVCLIWTNNFAFVAVSAKEQKEERMQKLFELKSKTKYRDMNDQIRENDEKKRTKKFSAIRNSLKKDGKYRLLIRSDKGLDALNGLFWKYESNADTRAVVPGVYEVKIDEDSDYGREMLSDVSQGKIPERLEGYEVLPPSDIESFQAEGYLDGERLSDLWGITKIGADKHQKDMKGLLKTKVAVLDSGIYADHVDLKDNIDTADGYDFTENDAIPQDDSGHGTHIAGIIAGAVNGKGVFGVNSNAEILPVKVLDANGMGSSYDVIEAIDYAVNKGAKVLNLSFGGYGDPATDPICQVISDAKAAGVTTVVAVGNSNTDVSNIVPAGCPDAITVGAIGKDGNKAVFSNYGSNVTVSAPGVEILSTSNDGWYKSLDGTSMSSAFVAGAVSAILALDASKSPDEIKSMLKSSGNVLDMDALLLDSWTISLSSGFLESTPPAAIPSSVMNTGLTLSGTTASGTYARVIQDPGLYYSGVFRYNDIWYGNSYYAGVIFPEEVLKKYNVQVTAKKSQNAGVMTAMLAPTDGLIAEWKLNGNWNDSGPNRYNPVESNGVSFMRDYAYFSGNSYLKYPYGINVQGNNSRSVSLWFNSDSSQWGWLINLGNHNSYHKSWGIYSNGSYFYVTRYYDDVYRVLDNNLFNGQWHHAVANYNWDSNTTTIYIDGKLVEGFNNPVGIPNNTTAADVYLGLMPNAASYTWKMKLVRIYNRILTSSEISSLYDEWVWSNNFQSKENGLLGEWRLDGNALDTSGLQHDGMAYNITWWTEESNPHQKWYGSFNGYNSEISLPTTSFQNISDYTISAWINPQWDTDWWDGKILDFGSDWSHRWLIAHETYWWLKKFYFIWTTSYYYYTNEQWYHLVGVKNGTVASLYVNGQVYSSGIVNVDTINATYAKIWQEWNGGAPRHVNGKMNLIRFYNRALSLSEIQSLYHEWAAQVNTATTIPTPTQTGTALSSYVGSISKLVQNNNQLIASNFIGGLGGSKSGDKNGSKNLISDMADPVNLSNGEFSYENTFMSIPGVKLPYEFSLTYRNQLAYDGPVGHEFDHNYNVFLTENEDGSVRFYNWKLGIFDFVLSGSAYEYNKGLKAHLAKDGASGLYSLEFDDGIRYDFGANLRIAKIADRYGNFLSFAYNAENQLTTVTDTLGRNITYTYGTDTRLQRVTDFNNRSVELAYYQAGDADGGDGDIKSVTIKSGESTKTVSFTYDANHNIAALKDVKGQTYVQNVYDANGRVTSQTYGLGTVHYDYVLDGSRVATNTVTNANGTVTKYTFDTNWNTTKREIYDVSGNKTEYNYEFNTDGRLVKSILPRGNGTTYAYDARGNITEQREKTDVNAANSTDDLVTTTEYDATYDTPTKIILPNGLEKDFVLDGTGNILSETDKSIKNADNTTYDIVTSFEYDPKGQLTKKIDGEGNEAHYAYGSGQLLSITKWTSASAITESFTYDDYGNLLSSTDGEVKTTTRTYTPFNLLEKTVTPEGIEIRATYDANNNKIHEERYSLTGGIVGVIDYEYDILDRLAKKTEKIDATHERVTTMTYDGNGNLSSEQIGTKAKTVYVYDEMNRVKQKKIIADPNDISKDIVTSFVFDRNGNATQITDPRGNVSTFEYDLHDRKIKSIDPTGAYTTYAYDRAGNVTETKSYDATNVLLQKTTAEYDQLGHVLKTVKACHPELVSGSSDDIVVSAKYDKNGNTIEKTDAKGNKTTYAYDGFGRLADMTDALGNKVMSTYDKRGLVITKTVTSSGSTYSTTTNYSYDDNGRLISETDALGKTKTYAYDALDQVTAIKDESDRITTRTYDWLGHFLSETKTLTGTTNQNVTTAYAYDTTGNLMSVTDPNGNVTMYEYDNLNRKTKEILPDASATIFVYDKASNLVSTTDPNGTVTTNTYDALNRLQSRAIAKAAGVKGTSSESYSYDVLGRLASATSTWSISGTGQQANTLSFVYDSQDRLMSETQNGTTVSYAYDVNGNRTRVSAGTGYLADYAYDALDRLVSVVYNSGSIANYAYSGTLLEKLDFGNGTSTSYAYDELLRLNSLNHANASGSLATRSYAYDSVSNITSDGQRNYVYDSIDRLINTNALSGVTLSNTSEVFDYDLTGNRTTTNGSSYSGNILNQYLSVSGAVNQSFQYDANGNLINNGTFLFAYDYKNRLVEVKKTSDNSLVARYVYDILGRRVQKITPTTKTDYIYAGENAIIETNTNLQSSAQISTNRVYGAGTDDLLAYETDDSTLPPADVEEYVFCATRILPYSLDFAKYGWSNINTRCSDLQNQYTATVRKMFFVHKDHLNSTIALTDSSGSVVQEYTYDVYGSPYVKSGGGFVAMKDFAGNLHGNDRLFTGREYEKELNLYYYRARFYDPVNGRFISRDPIGMADDVNLYAYVKNNPVGANDPDGEKAKQMVVRAGKWMSSAIESLPEATFMMEYAGWSEDDNVITQQESTERANMLLLIAGWAMAAKSLWSIAWGVRLSEEEIWMQKSLQDAIEWSRNGTLKPAIGWWSSEMLGSKWTQTHSSTIWKWQWKERIDVENPAPWKRPGQIHYQDNLNNKYLYDYSEGVFYDTKWNIAPKSIQKLLDNGSFMKGIQKWLKYLGE